MSRGKLEAWNRQLQIGICKGSTTESNRVIDNGPTPMVFKVRFRRSAHGLIDEPVMFPIDRRVVVALLFRDCWR